MGNDEKPKFPLHAVIDEDTTWILENKDEVACNLEWCDTRVEDEIEIYDSLGRRVILVIKALGIQLLELE